MTSSLPLTGNWSEEDSDEEEMVTNKGIALLISLLPEEEANRLLQETPDIITPPDKILQSTEIVEEDHLDEMSSSGYPPPLSPGAMESIDNGHIVVRQRPQVPPKPPIDTVRYSMNNIKESQNWELDALLDELTALTTDLSTPGNNNILLGIPTMPASTSKESIKNVVTSSPALRQSEVERVPPPHPTHPVAASSCSSPDGDSAFGEGSSTESSRNRNSAFSSNDSCRDSLHTPSPTQISPRTTEQTPEEKKAAKIKEALEKMKEAKVTRIFVKFFVEDGDPLPMLVDERWTVAQTMKQLADKHQITLSEDHCIVEEFPDLYIKRIYEDHENLVENIQMWLQDSNNKLHFQRRPDKYPFVDRPELYLVTDKTTDLDVPQGATWTREVKHQFVDDFFSRETVVPPEMEGWLYLKSDARKTWKKYFFVLRPSGLYYSPKGKKIVSSKDLQCLMNLHSNQVYTGMHWAKKYKAPTDYCISIKLTNLQVKRSQYIKYICCDDEPAFRKWIVALRIAKNGAELYKNYTKACEQRRNNDIYATPSRSVTSCSSVVEPISVNTSTQPNSCSSSQHDLRQLHGKVSSLSSPSQVSRVSQLTCVSERSSVAAEVNLSRENMSLRYDEQPTGTIKRAPLDVIRRMSQSSNDRSSSTAGTPEDDSDEEFPAPPSIGASRTTTPAMISPVPPPKPSYYTNGKSGAPPTPVRQTPVQMPPPSPTPKKVPPPPPKRSEATKVVNSAPHKNDLEAALARRRAKMEQQV